MSVAHAELREIERQMKECADADTEHGHLLADGLLIRVLAIFMAESSAEIADDLAGIVAAFEALYKWYA